MLINKQTTLKLHYNYTETTHHLHTGKREVIVSCIDTVCKPLSKPNQNDVYQYVTGFEAISNLKNSRENLGVYQ